MTRVCIPVLVFALSLVPAQPPRAAVATGDPSDPDATLRQALLNMSNAPRIATTLTSTGRYPVGSRLVINTDRRYVFEKLTERGRVTKRSVETSRLAFTHNPKRHCWAKRAKRFNVSLRFKDMKRRITEAQQVSPDVIAYSHDDEFGPFRIEMRYDPASLLPLEFNATYVDDGQGEPAVSTYRITVAYTASKKIPRHRPVCRK